MSDPTPPAPAPDAAQAEALARVDGALARLTAENRGLREANANAIAKATQSALERQRYAELEARLAASRADAARADAWRRAFLALAEVAAAVHALVPIDALRDVDGARIVAAGRTQPQLLRALAELAVAPKEPG